MNWLRALKYFLRIAIGLWVSGIILAVAYRNNPIISTCVESIFVSVTGIFTDTREAQKLMWEEAKKEIKEKK